MCTSPLTRVNAQAPQLQARDPAAERGFREIARVTGGMVLPFDRSAPGEFAALLAAVAA